MGWGAAIGAVVGAGISYASAQNQRRDANEKWNFAQTQSATAAFADADAAMKAAEAEAASIMGQAGAEASAYMGQAEIERRNLYAAAEEARNISYQNIDKMKAEADESLRRLQGDQASWEAKARAKAAASGVRMQEDSSTGMYLTGMKDENKRQYGWLNESYQAGLNVARATAEGEYSVTKRQGDAAIEAASIKARAAGEAASYVANATTSSASYYSEAMRQKGNSYLAPLQAKAKGKEQEAQLWQNANAERAEYGGK